MANLKISDFTTLSYAQLDNPATAAIPIVDDGANYKMVVDQLFTQFSNAGAGAGVYKSRTGNAVSLRSITAGSDKVNVAENTDTISIDIEESNVSINNTNGTLNLAKGGTGKSLTNPGTDRLLFWDNSETSVDWLSPTSKFSITGTTLDVNENNINLDNCNNETSQFYKPGSALLTSGSYVTTPSTFEIGSASTQEVTSGTHVIEISLNGTVFKLLAIV